MAVTKIEITSRTIVATILYLIGFWFLYQIRGILITLFIAFILMTAIRPIVRAAGKFKIPTIVVVLLMFLLIIGLLTTLVVSLAPAVVTELTALVENLPAYLSVLSERWSIVLDPGLIMNQFGGIPSNLLKIAAGTLGNFVTILALFFMTYYLSVERPYLPKYLRHLFGAGAEEQKAEHLLLEVERGVGGWVRGELLLMVIIGVLSFVAFTLLGIPYALALALLAGIMEAVPNIGPTISAVFATVIGLTISPVTALGALAAGIIIQQLENNLIVPRVMHAATGTRPLVTIVILLTGYTLGGIVGAILAMPLFLTVVTVYKELHGGKYV